MESKKEIIHKEPWKYVLFKLKEDYILDVVCGGAAIYTVTVTLNQTQKEQYLQEGISYINRLAKAITKSPSDYRDKETAPT